MNCIDLIDQKHQTTQNYKSDQITTKCMDLTSKRTKMFGYVGNHSKQRKSTKVIKVQWSAWIWRKNEQKCWVTSETIQNNANLQKLSKYNEVHGFDVKTNKNVELRRKPFKTTQIYKNDQITMKCMDLMSKTSNNAKLQKWSNYDEVHGFDVKMNKNVELRRKPFKTTQIYKGNQNTMNCIDLIEQKHQTTQNYKSDQITTKCMDLTSKRTKMFCYVGNHSKQRKSTKVIKVQWSAWIWRQNEQKCWVTSQTIQNNANLQKWSNYDEVHGFDVKTNCIDLMSKR